MRATRRRIVIDYQSLPKPPDIEPIPRTAGSVVHSNWSKTMFFDRLKEPSTWASLAATLGALGFAVPEGLMQYITFAGMGLAGVLGFFMPEKKPE
jgi:hypothetical protein